jgi:hypothetical protein
VTGRDRSPTRAGSSHLRSLVQEQAPWRRRYRSRPQTGSWRMSPRRASWPPGHPPVDRAPLATTRSRAAAAAGGPNCPCSHAPLAKRPLSRLAGSRAGRKVAKRQTATWHLGGPCAAVHGRRQLWKRGSPVQHVTVKAIAPSVPAGGRCDRRCSRAAPSGDARPETSAGAGHPRASGSRSTSPGSTSGWSVQVVAGWRVAGASAACSDTTTG